VSEKETAAVVVWSYWLNWKRFWRCWADGRVTLFRLASTTILTLSMKWWNVFTEANLNPYLPIQILLPSSNETAWLVWLLVRYISAYQPDPRSCALIQYSNCVLTRLDLQGYLLDCFA